MDDVFAVRPVRLPGDSLRHLQGVIRRFPALPLRDQLSWQSLDAWIADVTACGQLIANGDEQGLFSDPRCEPCIQGDPWASKSGISVDGVERCERCGIVFSPYPTDTRLHMCFITLDLSTFAQTEALEIGNAEAKVRNRWWTNDEASQDITGGPAIDPEYIPSSGPATPDPSTEENPEPGANRAVPTNGHLTVDELVTQIERG